MPYWVLQYTDREPWAELPFLDRCHSELEPLRGKRPQP